VIRVSLGSADSLMFSIVGVVGIIGVLALEAVLY
jgi:hypothetical protein